MIHWHLTVNISISLCVISFVLDFSFQLQEFLVKNADRVELMAMLGLFGGIVSAIQMYPWNWFNYEEYTKILKFNSFS